MDSQVPIQEPKKVNNWLPIAAIALFVLLSLITVAFLYNQNQQLKKMLNTYQTQTSPSPSPTSDSTTNWETYVNDVYKFSFKYPSGWKISCSPPSNDNWDGIKICELTSPDGSITGGKINSGHYLHIGVAKPNSNYTNFDDYLKYYTKIDTRFQNKQINNIQGVLELKKDKSNGFFFESNGHFLHVGWLYVDNSNLIDQILSTFKFIEASPIQTPLSTQRACTMEAKMCPDGSFVGRTGPNCEFAPCPTAGN